jgi:predicted nucleic acid-binding protein
LISVDTSALQQYLSGLPGIHAHTIARAIALHEIAISPVVLAEALSKPDLDSRSEDVLLSLPILKFHDEYWRRTGLLRASILRAKLRAKLADSLIAQACIDHDLPLITYDDDFKNFIPAGLKLL